MGINEATLHEKLQFFLLKSPHIDGLILNSGKISASAIHALQMLNKKVGEDIQMVVFDENNTSINMSMGIETDAIVQDGVQIGYTACELLVRQLNSNEKPPQMTFIPLLRN